MPRRAIFVKGKYYVEIAAEPEGDHTAVLQAWTAALEKIVDRSSRGSGGAVVVSARRQQSLRLVPESVLGIRILKRGYVAQYDFGKAFVVTEASTDSAAAVMQKLRERFGETVKAADRRRCISGDRQVPGTDLHRPQGTLLAGYGNLADGQDAVKLATALAARLPVGDRPPGCRHPSLDRQVLHLAHPLQFALDVGVHLVFLLHVRDLRADHVDLGDVVVAQSQLAAVIQVARPGGIDAHALHAHAVRRNEIRGGDGDPRRHRRARAGPLPSMPS